jgi:hypothetical protein
MTEQSSTGPVPGPPRPVPGPAPSQVPPSPGEAGAGEDRFADLDAQPVADHVAVYEAEHERLQCELSTIDQL